MGTGKTITCHGEEIDEEQETSRKFDGAGVCTVL